jgi:2'-5' RNA ligase
MVRAFVALELSNEIQQNLKSAQDTLRQSRARLTFVDPAIIHITVKFLGEVDDRKLPSVIDVLKRIPFAPFPINAAAITVDNHKRPHTVWCSVEDGGKGKALSHLIEDTLGPLGFPREARPFTAHATVARVKSSDPSLFTILDSLKAKTFGTSTISGMKLKKSVLTPKGPVYEDLLEVSW